MNPKTSVLQLISSLEVGGAEKLLIDLLEASRQNPDVHYVVVVMNRHVNPDMRKALEKQGFPVYYLDRPEGHLHPKYLFELGKIIRRHDARVVHAHNRGSLLWGVLCKLVTPGLKLVYTVHDTNLIARMSKRVRFLIRRVVDCNIAISRAVEAECLEANVTNVQQIYNGIDTEAFEIPRREKLAERLQARPFEEDPLRLIQVARLDYSKKGQDILLRAVKLCRDNGLNVHCTLMGGVYDYNRPSFERLQELVHGLDLKDRISFIVNRTDVKDQLAKAEVSVLASRYEGLGLVVLEAMAAGLPVIASRIDGPRELVQDGKDGLLFESEDAQDLYRQIRCLYENPTYADQLADSAKLHARRYDIRRMAGQYGQLYQDLLALRSGNTAREALVDGAAV